MGVLLGLTWSEFQPEQGLLRAEGPNNIIISRTVPGVGTIVDFKRTRKELKTMVSLSGWEKYIIPHVQVYRMIFGIIPADAALIPKFKDSGFRATRKNSSSRDSRDGEAKEISIKEWIKVRQEVLQSGKVGDIIEFPTSDFLPLVAPMLRKPRSIVSRFPKCHLGKKAWLRYNRVYRAFPRELDEFLKKFDVEISQTNISKQIHDWCQELVEDENLKKYWYGKWWNDPENDEAGIVRFLDHVQELFNRAQEYLTTLIESLAAEVKYSKDVDDFYLNLVLVHLNYLIKSRKVDEKKTEETIRDLALLERGSKPADQLGYLFKNLDGISEDMNKIYVRVERISEHTTFSNHIIKEAWVAMIFRGMCWRHCHWYEKDDGEPVNSRYWKSKHEVYIG